MCFCDPEWCLRGPGCRFGAWLGAKGKVCPTNRHGTCMSLGGASHRAMREECGWAWGGGDARERMTTPPACCLRREGVNEQQKEDDDGNNGASA